MLELGQLEKAHQEFEQRKARVIVVSLEDQEAAKETQADFSHLVVVADRDRRLAESLEVIHPGSDLHGGDTTAPTTIIVDGQGMVRWTFRPDRFMRRLSPEELLAKLDEQKK